MRRSWPYGIDMRCLPPVEKNATKAERKASHGVPDQATERWRGRRSANENYYFLHMFNKPYKGSACSMRPFTEATLWDVAADVGRRTAWHASLVEAFGEPDARDTVVVPTRLLQSCAAWSKAERDCGQRWLLKASILVSTPMTSKGRGESAKFSKIPASRWRRFVTPNGTYPKLENVYARKHDLDFRSHRDPRKCPPVLL